MSRQKYRKQLLQKRNFTTFIGVGFLVLGVVSFLWLSQNESSSASTSQNDRSVTPMEVNFPAPEFSLSTLEGEMQSISDYKGKVVLVNNWATWCPPCKAEMPSLRDFHNAHVSKGFTVIAVEAGDPKEDVLDFANTLNLQFPVWLDSEGVSLKAIGNGSLPNSYVIDRTGTVRLAWTGEISLAMLEKYVTPIIQESN
ncbi:MAG: TlpA family protein disulfide reductase [Anaerolineae bacterium]|nr:TlpA family protein disulfide reductase [Anaerolineae bacterium]